MKNHLVTTALGLLAIVVTVSVQILMHTEIEIDALPIGEAKPAVKLRVAIWDYELQSYDQKLFDAFQRQNPDIELEVLTTPNTYYARKLNGWLWGREQVDVVFLQTLARYRKLIESKALQPLNRFMEKAEMAPNGYEESMNYNQMTYGIPYRGDWYVVYYNKTIFDRLKVPYPADDMTWAAYRALGKRLTDGEGEEKTYGIQSNMGAINEYVIPKNEWGQDFDYLYGDLEKIRKGLSNFMAIQNKDQSTLDYNTNYAMHSDQRYFELGKTAMFINGTWFANYLKEDKNKGIVPFEWGMAKLPKWPEENPYTRVTLIPIAMTSKCDNPEAAWRFIQFMTSDESAKLLAEELVMPATLTKPILESYVSNGDFPADSFNAILGNIFCYQQPITDSRAMAVERVVYEEVRKVLMNNQSEGEAMKNIEVFRNNLLNPER